MLTDVKLRALKRQNSLYRVADSQGLAVEVPPSGALRWRFRYRFDGKAKMLSFGTYPDVRLGEARDLRDQARRLLRKGTDPSVDRQEQRKATTITDAGRTFQPRDRFVGPPENLSGPLSWCPTGGAMSDFAEALSADYRAAVKRLPESLSPHTELRLIDRRDCRWTFGTLCPTEGVRYS